MELEGVFGLSTHTESLARSRLSLQEGVGEIRPIDIEDQRGVAAAEHDPAYRLEFSRRFRDPSLRPLTFQHRQQSEQVRSACARSRKPYGIWS